MQARPGPFWDGVQGRAPVPPAAATLGFEFVGADIEAGTIEVAFAATGAFTNPAGNVLGGFLAAMLFDTVGPALLATLGPDQFQSTQQLDVSFLRPVRPGRRRDPRRHRHRHRPGDPAQPRPGRAVTRPSTEEVSDRWTGNAGRQNGGGCSPRLSASWQCSPACFPPTPMPGPRR